MNQRGWHGVRFRVVNGLEFVERKKFIRKTGKQESQIYLIQ